LIFLSKITTNEIDYMVNIFFFIRMNVDGLTINPFTKLYIKNHSKVTEKCFTWLSSKLRRLN